jgi:hypothetical protein
MAEIPDITKRKLRAMRSRWERDLKTLEEAFPDLDLTVELGAEAETVRNLVTAIGEIDGIIANKVSLRTRGTMKGRLSS